MPQLTDIADLVATTLPYLNRGIMVDNVLALQDYPAASELLRKSRMEMGSGKSWEFRTQYRDSGAAATVEPFQAISVGIIDMVYTGTVPVRFINTHWAVEDREISANMGEARIFNLMKVRSTGAQASAIAKIEEQFWGKPADSTDKLSLWGVGMWLVSASGTPSFQGGNPAGFSSGTADVNSSTYTNFKNWAGAYTNITEDDLVDKIITAIYKTTFNSPLSLPTSNESLRRGIYTTFAVSKQLDRIAKAQNDQNGSDIARYAGKSLIKGHPIVPVPYLDANTTNNPVYGIPWVKFKNIVFDGEWQKRSGPFVNGGDGGQHRTAVTHEDYAINYALPDRRSGFVLTQ